MGKRRLRAVIAGATGYAGGELVRLLAAHPYVEIAALVSAAAAGKPVVDSVWRWRGMPALCFESFARLPHIPADVVFFAAPHGVAMQYAPALLEAGRVVIDIGSDFRLKDPAVFARWYGEHTAPEFLDRAVYGLSEFAREAIGGANLIACPGCYATAIQIALLPLVAAGEVAGDVVADAKSGVSGAGRQTGRADLLLAEMAENFKPYALSGHRHHAEIMQTLAAVAPVAAPPPVLHFVPHLLPIPRGIYASLYVPLAAPQEAGALLADYWRGHPFIEVLPSPQTAELAQTLHGNRIILSAHPIAPDRALVCAALDNLQKGAAGQAVQNMNIRFGLAETAGLGGAVGAVDGYA